jgi:multiple sugar transport system permease protein
VALVAAWSLLPFIWLILCSIMPTQDLISRPPRFNLAHVSFKNYIGLFAGGRAPESMRLPTFMSQLPLALWNSFVVSVAVTAINLVIGSLAGYAYARYQRYWHMRSGLLVLLATRMIPAMAIVIPFFIFFRRLGLQDSKLGLVIAYSAFVLPLAVWIMRGYFETVPRNLDRAALVDGCSRLQAFFRIILPVSRPGLMATGIFCFVVSWNQFIFALILSTSIQSQTVPVFLSVMRRAAEQYFSDYGPLFAATVMGALPAVIIAFVFQRYLIQGMLSGSAKG